MVLLHELAALLRAFATHGDSVGRKTMVWGNKLESKFSKRQDDHHLCENEDASTFAEMSD